MLPKCGLVACVGRVDGGQVLGIEVQLVQLLVRGGWAALGLATAGRAPDDRERTLFWKDKLQ